MGVRTNIVIDDELMAAAMQAAGTKTKRATVAAGLRELVVSRRRLEILDLVGKIEMLPFEEIRPEDSGPSWSS